MIKVQGRQFLSQSFCQYVLKLLCFETPVVLTTMKIGTVAAFLWLIASLSVQSGMYQLIEKLLAYLSIVLHASFLTLSIYFPNVSIHLSICLSLFTTVCGSGN